MEEKLCSICKTIKPVSCFDKNKSKKFGLHSNCKVCRKPETKRWYSAHKEEQLKRVRKNAKSARKELELFLINYFLHHPCIDCDEKDILVLEFDHLRDKDRDIGSMMRSRVSLSSIKKEIEKCVVRCSSCHRRKTMIENNSYRYRFLLEKGVISLQK